ncbi:MAG: carboxymuconolactone decarboxylase family protein [Pseudomonadales bacterium]|nr:carboxymuconolactone decarboxylase family protein [Pseudomonadales bacterium]MDP6471911.1 carboxymuconolactone decarboxylase family protein [Pseudomonadales bacterium]MDP6826819.1 carboxymuconolactone decarboxylase family protein [Pseudomonadales bacterium]MDP6970903.1 carboxymuconolactone decarboxylase family protein [Pseudomonadales bacterium]
MAHVEPRRREELSELEPILAGVEAAMGFVPNSMLTMAYMPQLTVAFSMLAGTAFGADLRGMMSQYADIVPAQTDAGDKLTPGMIQLIAYAASVAAGCRYCQAHTSHSAVRAGETEEKLTGVLEFETADVYSDAERAVIALALAAAAAPNEADANHFEGLRAHFTERQIVQIVQIVGIVSLFGFLNRWNDTMATYLEEHPKRFAQEHLGECGWTVSKHD